MGVFAYKGVTVTSGKTVKGFQDADSVKALRIVLRREGVMLTSAKEDSKRQKKNGESADFFAFLKRPKARDVAVMTRQLATLVRAGIPLVESISALVDQTEKDSMIKVLSEVREELKEGIAFAKALQRHDKVFVPLYINMVAAGEASGTLEGVLERLADFMEDQAKLKGKISGALAYPAIMTVIGGIMVSVLMIAVVPKVTSIYANLGQELPWYTTVLIFVSGLIAGYWWVLVGLAGGAAYLFRRWVSTMEGRLKFDTILLSVPIFGKLNRLAAVARFSRTLATLLASGVSLLAAMDIVKNVLGNKLLSNIVVEAASMIREGESIAEPLKRSGEFPPMLTHMIAIGEKTGELEQMLENVSQAYESDVEAKVAALTSLLEPLVIVVMGGVVGFIAMAIMMPLVQMNDMVD